jgi:hypothetical protein
VATALHRLQISLPESQVDFLAERARRDGVSIAEVVRQLVARAEAEGTSDADSFLGIAGIAEETGPILRGKPVSEKVDLYLAEATRSSRRRSRATRR